MKGSLGQHEALSGTGAETTKDGPQSTPNIDPRVSRRLTSQRATDAGRRVTVNGRLVPLDALEPVELEVVLEVERELGERLDSSDEVEEETVHGHVTAAGDQERRRRVVARHHRLLRLHVTQPEVQRLVAVSHVCQPLIRQAQSFKSRRCDGIVMASAKVSAYNGSVKAMF